MLTDRLFRISGTRYSLKTFLYGAIPHLIAIMVFLVVAMCYCKPVLDNKVLVQEDILQWRAMAQNSFQYKAQHGTLPLWSNGMFSGMPAYQIAMDGRSINLSAVFYNLLTLWLKDPVSYFFLACICFYMLAGVLRINPYIGIIVSLCYAYATYNPVIVMVGHVTKMQTIALFPAVIGSLILIFERKHWQGMAMTAICVSLIISFGHMQIVYYIFLTAVFLFVSYAIRWIKAKDYRHIYQAAFMALGATLAGVLCNAIVLFTNYDSSRETTRAGSELADSQSNYTQSGLSETAAFDFSMYKTEPLVMLTPDIYGGSSDLEMPEGKSKAAQVLDKMPPDVAKLVGEDGPKYYWGGVGSLFSGPPYSGAIICLLALAGFFVLDNKHKWWIGSAILVTVFMSWGSYFQAFNGILLKYLPMYNKFRAPSMILVVPTFLMCMLAAMALQKIWMAPAGDREAFWARYRWALLAMTGVFGILLLLYARFGYTAASDRDLLQQAAARGTDALKYMRDFVAGLQEDRRALFLQSILRSFLFIAGATILITIYVRRKMSPILLLAGVGVLAFVDLISVDLQYLNYNNYQEKVEYQQNFNVSEADRKIMEDKGYYRVFDIRDSASKALSYGAFSAYFHQSIGGYHAAKLRIYEDLINHQLFNYPNCIPVIDMLNTKYIIRPSKGEKGDSVYRNPGSLGPAWFVKSVVFKNTPQEVMGALTSLHPKDTAVVFTGDKDKIAYDADADSSGMIQLIRNDNDVITYRSASMSDRFAVFSEIFYERGWKAWIDTHQVPIVRTNYVLRGISVPAGKHIIRFAFRPLSFYIGRQVQWMASILLVLLIVGGTIVMLHDLDIHIWVAGRQVLKIRPEHLSSR